VQAVTVILPTKATSTRVECLHRAIRSVLSQQNVRAQLVVIANGSHYDPDLLSALARRPDLRLIHTGKHAISDVVLTRDLYRGEYLGDLPDVLVFWSHELPLGTAAVGKPGNGTVRLGSDKIGVIEGENRYCRTGEHRPDGMFIASGPGLEPGTLQRTVSIVDFAPTITRLLDVDLPDVDGQPIRELLAESRGGKEADGRHISR